MFYVGPYVRSSNGFDLPPGARSGIPLRAPENDDDGGLLLFRSNVSQTSDYKALGDPGDQIRGADKTWILDRLGLSGSFAGEHWRAVIYEVMTSKSDPMGVDTCPAKRPNNSGRNLIYCDGIKLIDRPVDLQSAPEAAAIVARIRWMYKQKRANTSDGMDYRKWLQRLLERHRGYNYRLFQGSEPDETPLPHSTEISDDFGTDETTDGSDFFLDNQSSGQWTMQAAGVYDVSSNRLVKSTNSNVGIRCDGTTFASSDMEAGCVVRSGVFGGPTVACKPADPDGFLAYLGYIGGNVAYIRRTTGTATITEVANSAWTTPSNPVALKLDYDSDEILHLYGDAGTAEASTLRVTSSTDTTLDSYANAGAHIYSNGGQISDWYAGDLASGTTYNETGSGGAVVGGSATVSSTFTLTGSGTVTVGGSATPELSMSESPSGGAVISGEGTVNATMTESPSGGIVLDGTATVESSGAISETGSGGVVLAGDGVHAATFTETGSGGAVVGGESIPALTMTETAGGGISLSGTGVDLSTFTLAVSGGAVLGGSATVESSSSISETGSGGAVLGGSATDRSTYTVTPSGGVQISGVATVNVIIVDVGGPFFVDASAVFVPGAITAQVFVPGAVAAQGD